MTPVHTAYTAGAPTNFEDDYFRTDPHANIRKFCRSSSRRSSISWIRYSPATCHKNTKAIIASRQADYYLNAPIKICPFFQHTFASGKTQGTWSFCTTHSLTTGSALTISDNNEYVLQINDKDTRNQNTSSNVLINSGTIEAFKANAGVKQWCLPMARTLQRLCENIAVTLEHKEMAVAIERKE